MSQRGEATIEWCGRGERGRMRNKLFLFSVMIRSLVLGCYLRCGCLLARLLLPRANDSLVFPDATSVILRACDNCIAFVVEGT